MKKLAMKMIFFSLFISFTLSPFMVKADAPPQIHFNVKGTNLVYQETLVMDGNTYVPVRKFTELLGATVSWDSKLKQVTLSKEETTVQLIVDQKKIKYNQEDMYLTTPAIIKNGVTYGPVRFLAEILRNNVAWDNETLTVTITEQPSYIVKAGDTLTTIGEATTDSVEDLKTWNQLDNDNIIVGSKLYLEALQLKSIDLLKTHAVIPYDDKDLDWLAKIVYSEARDEPYEGLVAVAAVIINRVKDTGFPDTIHDVIFDPYQFSPVSTGKIYDIIPDQESYKAAEEALLGSDPVANALFFYNPRKSNSTFFAKKHYITDIGNHRFYSD